MRRPPVGSVRLLKPARQSRTTGERRRRVVYVRELAGQFTNDRNDLSDAARAVVDGHFVLRNLWDIVSPEKRRLAAQQLDSKFDNLVDLENAERGFRRGANAVLQPARDARRRQLNKLISRLRRPGAQKISDEAIRRAARGRSCAEAYRAAGTGVGISYSAWVRRWKQLGLPTRPWRRARK